MTTIKKFLLLILFGCTLIHTDSGYASNFKNHKILQHCCRHEAVAQYLAAMDMRNYNEAVEYVEIWWMRVRGNNYRHVAIRVYLKNNGWYWVRQGTVWILDKYLPDDLESMDIFQEITLKQLINFSVVME